MSDDNIRKQAKAIVDASPELKRAKDISNGFSGKGFGATHGGKGSARRIGDEQAYKDNFDKIDWGKNKVKPKFKTKVNGVYIDHVNEQEIDKS